MAYSFLQATTDNASGTSYTFTGQNLGAADATRSIIVAFMVDSGSVLTVTGVTVGGVTATIDHAYNNTRAVGLARASVPAGTTGDVVVTCDASGTRCAVALWRVTGVTLAVADHDESIANPVAITLTPGGAGDYIFAAARGDTTGGGTWTGPTEDFDVVVEATRSFSGASLTTPDGSSVSVGANFAATSRGVAVAYTPTAAGGTDYTANPAEAVGATDTAEHVVDTSRQPADPVGMVDTAATTTAADRTQADTAGITDTVTATRTISITVSDSLTLLDTGGPQALDFGEGLADAVGVVDATTVSITFGRTVSDGLGVADAAGGTTAASGSISEGDPLGIADALTSALGADRAPSDPVGLTDTVTVQRVVTIADGIELSDSTSRAAAIGHMVADALGLLDQVAGHLGVPVPHITPAGRTLTIPAAVRVLTIPAADRTLTIAAAPRTR